MEEMQMRIQVEGFLDPLEGFVGFEDPLLGRELLGRTVQVQVPGLEGLDLFRFQVREFEDPLVGQVRFEREQPELFRWLKRRETLTFRFERSGEALHIH